MADFDPSMQQLPPQEEMVTVPRALLEELLGRSAILEAQAAELSARAAELRMRLGEVVAYGLSEAVTNDNQASVAQQTAEDELKAGIENAGVSTSELRPAVTLFSVAEANSRVDQETIQRLIENEQELREGVHKMVEPYYGTLFGEMLFRISDKSDRPVAPAQAYANNPEAWHEHINKKGKTILWEESYSGTTHSFALTYLPLADGNRLVRFTSNTDEVRPDPDGGKDRFLKKVELAFDGGELVEATLASLKSAGDYRFKKIIAQKKEIRMSFGKKMRISELRYSPIAQTEKLKAFVYEPGTGDGTFVDEKATRKHVKPDYPISRSQCLAKLDEILGAIPTIAPHEDA